MGKDRGPLEAARNLLGLSLTGEYVAILQQKAIRRFSLHSQSVFR